MKGTSNNTFSKERFYRIEKEVNDKYNSYLKKYSVGFSDEELENELFLTKEEIMVIKCEVDALKEELTTQKPTNVYIVSFVFAFTLVFNLMYENRLISLLLFMLNLFIVFSSSKKIKAINLNKAKRKTIFELEKKALYLDLKASVIEGILAGVI